MNRRDFIKGLTGSAVAVAAIPFLPELGLTEGTPESIPYVPSAPATVVTGPDIKRFDLTEDFFEYLKFNPGELDIPYSRTINGHFWINERGQQVYRSTERRLSLLCATRKCQVSYTPEMAQDLKVFHGRDSYKIEKEIRDIICMNVANEMNEWAKKSGAIKYFINSVITTQNIYDINTFVARRGIMVRFAHITPEILRKNNVQVIIR